MQDHPVPSFDDPALKAALRRALDSDAAPTALRDRIRALAAEEADRPALSYTASAPEPAPSAAEANDRPIPLFRRNPLYRLAVAAVLIIGIGVLALQLWNTNRPAPAYTFSNTLFKGMVTTHNARATDTEMAPDTVKSLAEAPKLSQQINRPVLAADLTKDGWTFDGGAVRTVGTFTAAQLFFNKGNAVVSVFSLPASAAPNAVENSTYDTVFQGAPIAGFVKNGGLFCIVGSSPDGSLTVGDVKGLLERHKGELVKI
jgi:anti-sigma factor RsiW